MKFPVMFLLLSTWCLFWNATLAAVIGIDYGQQFLKAMVVSPKAPMELILTPEAKRKDVSGLAIKTLDGKGAEIERIYGSAVGSMATRFPKNTLLHIKPLLGKTEKDEREISLYMREHPGVNIVPTERNSLAFLVDNVQYPVEEITAMNLQEMINRANSLLRDKDPNGIDVVDKLAITVPEFFDQYQREALLDSAHITKNGLETVLINDGLSVMMNFALKKRDFTGKSYYIVFDMGGGSTKASLFSIERPENDSEGLRIEFGGYGYNPHLGGSKFTLDVANLIENKFLANHKKIRTEELHRNPKTLAKFVQAAEKAKLILSANSEASISIESVINDIDLRTKITKEELEEFNEDTLSDIVMPIKDALTNQLWEDQVQLKQLAGVILTGGSSRVPLVQHEVNKFVGESKVLKNVNADEAAVDGATIRGVKLFEAFRTKPLNVTERSISDYSMKRDDKKTVVFPKGTIFPASKTMTIGNAEELKEDLLIDLYEESTLFESVKTKTLVADKIYSPEKCPEGIIYNATFSLSQNRLFGIDKIEAICSKGLSISGGNSKNDTTKADQQRKTNLGGSKRPLKLTTSSENTVIKAMSLEEQLKLREHIKVLDEKDTARFELEEAKNLLEGLLYETRFFLEMEEVAEKGPQTLIAKLARAVTDHLTWLEDETDNATKEDVILKSLEVQQLKDKIDAYLQSLSEPLDSQQFETLLDSANELLARFTLAQGNHTEHLEPLRDNFTDLGYDIHEQYSKISLPHHIAAPLKDWNDTLSTFKDAVTLLEYAMSGDEKNIDRERLFEIKSAFDVASAEIKSIIEYFDRAREYRLRELQSLLQKTEKAKRRKEERLRKKREEKEKTKDTNNPNNQYDSEKSSLSSTASSSAKPEENASSQTHTSSTIAHDEL
ncbi:LHS1 (YKL073W) [Zygosaccharomyces parabailii]|uniref:BN860_18294g1_1 n=1 Tax=Zygosaccharomyces bailii (strain CLIB 213 / ATCC 58445 / CBS 680 / BCRC 21525 / NBRC 1098 / NCYC 1416 / NRRL Y-2227) TaxID=1333698 RepID=A0A8J2X6K0_ZYGB2|nr:LHS1 (YKL073W) [Zygosaccharomyces parabailii]CDF87956.1 BN860_18294g1_1 [Zygosaccharomyces bailii CLIB 213]